MQGTFNNGSDLELVEQQGLYIDKIPEALFKPMQNL